MATKTTKIKPGAYKVTDEKGTFIVRKNGEYWTAYDCECIHDTTDANNWGVGFRTKKELLNYAKNF